MREPMDMLLYLALALASLLLRKWGTEPPPEEEVPAVPKGPARPTHQPVAAPQLAALPPRPASTAPPPAVQPAGAQCRRTRHRHTGWKKAIVMQALLTPRA